MKLQGSRSIDARMNESMWMCLVDYADRLVVKRYLGKDRRVSVDITGDGEGCYLMAVCSTGLLMRASVSRVQTIV